jgi:uncharacterized protein
VPISKRRKIIISLTFFLTGLAGCLLIYAFQIEPYNIEVTRHRIVAPLRSPLKIAHLSDLHTRGFGPRERDMVAILNRESPDLIVVTGDTITNSGTYEMCREVFERLKAPLGVWVVQGNWENWRPTKDRERVYEAAGVELLLNSSRKVREDLWIMGFDDALSGTPELNEAIEMIPPDAFKIALFHSPIYFDQVSGKCDLAFAGHTHGGQIRLPLLRPLWLPPGSGRFLEGWYEQSGSRMYVSRGIGNSLLNARFLCPPEIAFIIVGP